jgi:hypothetical protein
MAISKKTQHLLKLGYTENELLSKPKSPLYPVMLIKHLRKLYNYYRVKLQPSRTDILKDWWNRP